MWVEDVACFLKQGERTTGGKLSRGQLLNPPPLLNLHAGHSASREVQHVEKTTPDLTPKVKCVLHSPLTSL